MSNDICRRGGDIPFRMKQNRRAFIRSTALIGGAMTLPGFAVKGQDLRNSGSLTSGPDSERLGSMSVREQFQSPPKKYRPLVRWWWPGNDVTDEELRREIGVLDDAGFAGAEIQAFVKGFFTKDLPEAQAQRVNGFATPSFFRHVGVAAGEA